MGIDRHELEHRNYRPDRRPGEAQGLPEEPEIDGNSPSRPDKPSKNPAPANQNTRYRKTG
jgi:hypothetical protein